MKITQSPKLIKLIANSKRVIEKLKELKKEELSKILQQQIQFLESETFMLPANGNVKREEDRLDHNKKALNDVVFNNAKTYLISGKNYFTKKQDSGTKELITDIKRMHENERLAIIANKIQVLFKRVSSQATLEIEDDIRLFNSTEEEIESGIRELQKTKKNC